MSEIPSPHAQLTQFLAHTDAPCPSCGYNIRALLGDRCPECNEVLALRVGLAEPKLKLWVAGLVSLAGGAGFSTLLFIFFIVYIFFIRNGPPPSPVFVVTIGGAVIEGAALILWLRFGPAIRRKTHASRLALCMVTFILTVVNLIAFCVFVR